jgi:hypothetical protein
MTLKIGDMVEVKSGNEWAGDRRIFVKHGKNDSVIVVVSSDNKNFKNGNGFDTMRYEDCDWREIKEPEIVPFDFLDAEFLIGKVVKKKGTGGIFIIHSVVNSCIYLDQATIFYNKLLENYTFLDGLPCGKVKED